MNCEKCQQLISDLLDGSISRADQTELNLHLQECLDCFAVHDDLNAIVGFCRAHRGEYVAPANVNAMWLRIRNTIEGEAAFAPSQAAPVNSRIEKRSFSAWLNRSWELSLPQLAASVAVLVLFVSLATAVGLRRWQSTEVTANKLAADTLNRARNNVRDRVWQQQQLIDYWKQRVEFNKSRWNPQMRETFERNMKVIDTAVSDSMNGLNQDPHDEISEEMLNAALNEKLALLKEFADL